MLIDLLVTCFAGIAEVIGVGVAGALIVMGFRPSSSGMDILNRLFIRITLPCLVFSNMATQFDVDGVAHWWIFPLLGIGLFIVGGILALLYTFVDRSVADRGIFTASVTFHNSILLPLAFAPILFSGERLPVFLNLLFLYNILTVPAFFSIGVWMVHASSERSFRITDILNPPIIATVLGLLFAVTGWGVHVPVRMMAVFRQFGSLSTPLSILIVGGVIVTSFAKTSLHEWREPLKIAALKNLVLPCLAILFVAVVRLPADIALFIVMGSVMPVGSVIAVVAPPDEHIRKTIAGGILLSNLASIVIVPLFMSLYGLLYGW